ncbi:adenosylcobinamide-GDP ribazoletransferase [Chloroflexota bacterium]
MKLGNDVRGAFAFLSMLPAWEDSVNWDQPGRFYAWFPLVGLVIGLLVALVASVQFLPPDLTAFLALLTWVALTGGLHLDGVGDSADGLLASVEPARRLEIMKDSRAGSWAVIALILLLLGKYLGLRTVSPLLLIAPPVVARWVLVLATVSFPYARKEGMGGMFRAGLGRSQVIIATLLTLIIVGVLAIWAAPVVLLAPLLGLVVCYGGGRWATGRIGGLTGDVYGALAEVTELVCLIALGLSW